MSIGGPATVVHQRRLISARGESFMNRVGFVPIEAAAAYRTEPRGALRLVLDFIHWEVTLPVRLSWLRPRPFLVICLCEGKDPFFPSPVVLLEVARPHQSGTGTLACQIDSEGVPGCDLASAVPSAEDI